MTTYTPGPWALGRHPHNIVGIVNGVSEIVAMVGDMPCVNGHDDLAAERGSEMERANAHLIASAPDMLEMLRICHGWLQGSAPHRASAVGEVIAKATGAQP